MRLTAFTDYTLRTLMYLGTHRDQLVTIQEIADLHNISKNHLMKVVHQLGMTGMVETVRGRNGGLRLALEPADINIGEVVRIAENDFYMAECFDGESNQCIFNSACVLKGALIGATDAYLKVLDKFTLKQLIARPAIKDGTVKPVKIFARGKSTT
jgi:Rrf2 family nitric oxide-sensitive transcriptional repressor